MTKTEYSARAELYIDYYVVATAKLFGRKFWRREFRTDAVVAAFRRLWRHGWLSGPRDPRTLYTMRPDRYTPAEQAVVGADLDLRRDAFEISEATHAALMAESDHMRRTRTEPATEPTAQTAEAAWFEETMTEAERQAWIAERTRNEEYARSVLETGRAA